MKIIILFFIVLISLTSGAQDKNAEKALYIKKGKSFNTAGWICIGSGSAAVLTGMLIPRGELLEEGFWVFEPDEYKNTNTKITLIFSGTVAMVTSIFLFASGSTWERRAVQLSLKNVPGSALIKNDIATIQIPSLNLKLRL